MALARIITRDANSAIELRQTLESQGYSVEVLSPETISSRHADLEFDLEQDPEAGIYGDVSLPVEREFLLAPAWRALKARIGSFSGREPFGGEQQQEPAAAAEAPDAGADVLNLEFSAKRREAAKLPEVAEAPDVIAAPQAASLLAMAVEAASVDAVNDAVNTAPVEETITPEPVRFIRTEPPKYLSEPSSPSKPSRWPKWRAAARQRAGLYTTRVSLYATEARRMLAEWTSEREAKKAARREVRLAQEKLAQEMPAMEPRIPLPLRLKDHFVRAGQTLRDSTTLTPSNRPINTRDYAWRQAMPVAAGIVLAFLLGWIGHRTTARDAEAKRISGVTVNSGGVTVNSGGVTVKSGGVTLHSGGVTLQPAPAHLPTGTKPAAARTQQRLRASSSAKDNAAWDDGNEVVVIHHYPGKTTLAQKDKGKQVRRYSDIQ